MSEWLRPKLPWQKIVIGKLWWQLGKRTGREYLQGKINGESVVILRNEKMMEGDPDFTVYKNTTIEERKRLADEVLASKEDRRKRHEERRLQRERV